VKNARNIIFFKKKFVDKVEKQSQMCYANIKCSYTTEKNRRNKERILYEAVK